MMEKKIVEIVMSEEVRKALAEGKAKLAVVVEEEAEHGQDRTEGTDRPETPAYADGRLRVTTYNIGHFALGKGGPGATKITAEKKAEMRSRYLEYIKEVNGGVMPDVLGMCEYDEKFAQDGTLTDEYLFGDYRMEKGLTGRSYCGNVVMTRGLKVVEGGYVKADIPNGAAYRDLVWQRVTVNGKEVLIVQTHIAPKAPAPGIAKDEYEQVTKVIMPHMEQLAEIFRKEERVVMMADWNMTESAIFERMMQYDDADGKRVFYYGMGWGDNTKGQDERLKDGSKKYLTESKCLGLQYAIGKAKHPTVLNDKEHEYAIDNIIVKGVVIEEVRYANDKGLSDHPIVCAVVRV